MAKRVKQPVSTGPWLTVMNYAKREEKCSHCGQVALIFSADHTAEREVYSRCKPCLVALAARDALEIVVKTTWPRLQEVWSRNRRVDARPGDVERLAAMRARRVHKPFDPLQTGIPAGGLAP